MLASIFWVIIDRQKSFLFATFSRVSNCQRTRKGLAEYPDAPATQTIESVFGLAARRTKASRSANWSGPRR